MNNPMTLQNLLDTIPTVISLASLFAGLWWAIVRELRTLREENRENYTAIDKRIYGVEIIVGPYAQDISALKETQTRNIVELTELKTTVDNFRSDQMRMQREIENIRSR